MVQIPIRLLEWTKKVVELGLNEEWFNIDIGGLEFFLKELEEFKVALIKEFSLSRCVDEKGVMITSQTGTVGEVSLADLKITSQTAGKVEFAIKIKVNGAVGSLDTPSMTCVWVCYN